MHPTRFAPLLAAPLAFVSVAFAADPPKADVAFTNPGFANPDTPGLLVGQPRGDVPNTSDIVFLKNLAIGGRAEVELGKLAQQRSSTAAIDEFAGHMVKDHSAANDRLAAVAKSARVELPTMLDTEHQLARTDLEKRNARDFDVAYLAGQITEHQKAVELLIYEVGSGQHAGTREYAAETLPVVMAHLENAKARYEELTHPAR